MARRLGDRTIVRLQGPVGFVTLHSRPQPDLALLRPRKDYSANCVLSAQYGRRKAPLYARAGVRELWLVDIPAGVVDVQRVG
jgi:hypothetical protein